jgi:hypothetical protein
VVAVVIVHNYSPGSPPGPTAQEVPMAVSRIPFEDRTATVPLNEARDAFVAPESPLVHPELYDPDLTSPLEDDYGLVIYVLLFFTLQVICVFQITKSNKS